MSFSRKLEPILQICAEVAGKAGSIHALRLNTSLICDPEVKGERIFLGRLLIFRSPSTTRVPRTRRIDRASTHTTIIFSTIQFIDSLRKFWLYYSDISSSVIFSQCRTVASGPSRLYGS